MNDELKVKVKQQLARAYYNGLDREGWSIFEEDEAIAAIDQAYKDAGYSRGIPLEGGKEVMLMTGQEFYKRLEKELAGLKQVWKHTDDLTWKMLSEAAKRAACLTD